MTIKFKEEDFIRILKKTGLNEKEALIYFELINQGSRGSTVYELDHQFDHVLKRTTIYSILRKLIDKGYIKESPRSKTVKKATIFIAVKPEEFFNKIITEKQEVLNSINELKDKYLDYFDFIYRRGMEYSLDDLDDTIRKYLKPLVEKGWKIISFFLKEKVPMFEYSVYDCMLQIPEAKYLKESSFHLFLFDYDIEKDTNAFNFFIRGMKNETKEILSHFTDIKEYKLEDIKLEFFKRTYPDFNISIKFKDMKKSRFFEDIITNIKTYWKEGEKRKYRTIKLEENKEVSDVYEREFLPDESFDIWKAVIIPIKNKLFFLWAESHEFLKEFIESIFIIEKIPINVK